MELSDHAGQRAWERTHVRGDQAPEIFDLLWSLGRNATDQDLKRFNARREPEKLYRIAVWRYATYILIRGRFAPNLITLWPDPRQ